MYSSIRMGPRESGTVKLLNVRVACIHFYVLHFVFFLLLFFRIKHTHTRAHKSNQLEDFLFQKRAKQIAVNSNIDWKTFHSTIQHRWIEWIQQAQRQNTYISIDSIFGFLTFLLSLCVSRDTLLTGYAAQRQQQQQPQKHSWQKKFWCVQEFYTHTHIYWQSVCVLDPFACHEYKSISTQSKQ